MTEHPMTVLIDRYLEGLPVERDLISAKEVRDLLLDIRLTFMVQGDEPEPPKSRIVRNYWNQTRGDLQQ